MTDDEEVQAALDRYRRGGRLRRFLVCYVLAVDLLHTYGERAWPWNVREVWPLVVPSV